MRALSPPPRASATALRLAWWTLLLALAVRVAGAKLVVQAEAPQAASLLDDSTPSTKTWTIRTSDSNGSSDELRALSIDTLCNVFVSYDPAAASGLTGRSDTLRAIVRVNGDDQWSVNALSVSLSSTGDAGGGDGSNYKLQLYSGRSDTVTEIILIQPYQVQSLSVLGQGDVVVGDQVLAAGSGDRIANDDSTALTIDVSSLGNVFVSTTEPLKATTASFRITGSGNLELEALEFHFEALTVKNSEASADIKLLSSLPSSRSTVSNASVTTAGSGNVCWDVPNLHVGNLKVSIDGSGTIGATDTGSCDTETVRVSGSGGVKLGSVSCQRAQVAIVGSGDAVVQASQYLGGIITGSGTVKYTGQQPLTMSNKNGQVGTSNPSHAFKAIAKPTTPVPGPKCAKSPVPALKTHKKSSNGIHGPSPSGDYPGGPSGEAAHQIDYEPSVTGSDSTSSEPSCAMCKQLWDAIKANSTVVIPAGVFIAFWLVILLRSRQERGRRRRRRSPEQQYLLDHEEHEDKPVYV